MQQQLKLLQIELANVKIELDPQLKKEKHSPDYDIQFTFNGFISTTLYQFHLRNFYNQFKVELEGALDVRPEHLQKYQLLETVRLHIIESEMLDWQAIPYDIHMVNYLLHHFDIRMEADIKHRFGKK